MSASINAYDESRESHATMQDRDHIYSANPPSILPMTPNSQSTRNGPFTQTMQSPVLDEDAFPSLGSTKPVNSLPKRLSQKAQDVPAASHRSQEGDFEVRLRTMILQNDNTKGNAGQSEETTPHPFKSTSKQPRPHRNANQAERKQQTAKSREILAGVPKDSRPRPTISDNAHGLRQSRLPESIQNPRKSHPYTNLAHHGRNDMAHPTTRQHPMQTQSYPSNTFRPPPRNTQLFDPYQWPQGRSKPYNRQTVSHTYVQSHHFHQQHTYLQPLIHKFVAASEISSEELDAAQRLRQGLEGACRKSIADFETQQNPDFLAITVELTSFGSLATTFATKGSDMDLVLVSPHSKPNASSIDSPLPRLIEKTLLDLGYGARLLTRTRVPIIKFCESPTPDLAERLREARRLWEEEQNVISPKLKPKHSMKKRSNLPNSNKSDSADLPETAEKDDQTLNDDKAPDGGSSPINSNDLLLSSGNAITEVDDGLQSNQPMHNIQSTSKSVNTMPHIEDRLGLEQDDPSLGLKSDKERVRLYNLAMKEEWYEQDERYIIMDYIRAFETGAWKSVLDEAREKLKTLPNVLKRYRPAPEKPLEFPKVGVGIHCDINFSNVLALHNSALLRCYSLCDPRVRPMVLFIKNWAKTRKINSAYEGTLSSYGYVLMVLHFLVNITFPPVLPNLQHFHQILEDEMSSELVMLDGCNVQFYRNEAILKDLAAQGRLTANNDPVEVLVRGFFAYYGSDGPRTFHWMRDCLSLRTPGGLVSKESKGWTAAKTEVMEAGPGSNQTKDIRQRYLVAIEDPFETHHNVGRPVTHDGIVAIRDEMRRAQRLIQSCGVGQNGPENLLAEAERKGNVHYRFFGPRHLKKINSTVKPNRGGSLIVREGDKKAEANKQPSLV